MKCRHPDGFFGGSASPRTGTLSIVCVLCRRQPGIRGPVSLRTDPRCAGRSPVDRGHAPDLYERLGAHPMTVDGVDGVHFAVWAPNAARVSVVGDFNAWDGRRHPMRKRIDSGLWEIFTPGIGEGAVYKYEIAGADGTVQPLKADPVRFRRGNAAVDRVCRCAHGQVSPGPTRPICGSAANVDPRGGRWRYMRRISVHGAVATTAHF